MGALSPPRLGEIPKMDTVGWSGDGVEMRIGWRYEDGVEGYGR